MARPLPQPGDPLTKRQAAVLETLQAMLEVRVPTVRELAGRLGMSAHGAFCHLQVLRAKGVVDWDDGLARTLRVTSSDKSA